MSKFYLVPLPLGNLKDITLRALETLKKVNFILAESPKKTLRLLNHFGIKKSIYPFFEFKNEKYLKLAISQVKKGKDVAFVSEAGTPGISDPGKKLLNELLKNDIEIEALPGPSALSLILSLSEFFSQEAVFYGFLPKKKRSKIKKRIINDLKNKRELIFFFSPFRLKKDLEFLKEINDSRILLLKEATKINEKVFRGKISEVLEKIEKEPIKGEWTGLISL